MLQRADAIVVLGCKVLLSGDLAPAALRRVTTAATAYHDGVAPVVVASGGRRWGANMEACAFSRELQRKGVPPSAILRELWSLTTYENAIFSAAILRRFRAKSAIVVTCPWHMQRAIQNFTSLGFDVYPLPSPPVAEPHMTETLRQLRELVSGWMDARAMRRHRTLRNRAEAFLAPFLDRGALS